MKAIRTTAERWRRHQRELAAYRRRSLWRRSHGRFHRDHEQTPFLFLAGDVRAAALRGEREDVVERLREAAIWTLDTASRLACDVGVFPARDLTLYGATDLLDRFAEEGLVEPPHSARLSLDPVVRRPRFVVVCSLLEPPPAVELPSGHRVVAWERWRRDLMGTVGWRPDLLDRVEERYRTALDSGGATAADPARGAAGDDGA